MSQSNPFTNIKPKGVSKNSLRLWFDWGKAHGYDYMIVVCDELKWEDYPIYSYTANYDMEYTNHYNKNMQKIREVYDLGADRELQLTTHRTFRGPRP